MADVNRLATRITAVVFAMIAASAVAAPPPIQLRNDILDELHKPRAASAKIVIEGQ